MELAEPQDLLADLRGERVAGHWPRNPIHSGHRVTWGFVVNYSGRVWVIHRMSPQLFRVFPLVTAVYRDAQLLRSNNTADLAYRLFA